MTVAPLPHILEITPYKGGESALPGFARPIKLASNENPLGASPAAVEAVQAAATRLALYPEGAATALREAIGARHGLDPARTVVGAGSDELFQLLARAFLAPGDEIIQSQYAFLVYRLVAQQSAALVRTAEDQSFTADVDAILAALSPRTRIVFLANPNNPTGTYLPAGEVARLHAALPENVLLVLDAAYAEYVQAPDYEAGLGLAAQAQNVFVTHTFSKIYGLAALRLGWGYGPAGVIDALNRVRGPFNVSAPALAAGVAALADEAFVRACADLNAAERARVAGGLGQLGLAVTPSAANFVLAHFTAPDAATVDQALRQRGLIVRALGAYGLPGALRISIGAPAENDALLAAMAEIMGAA